VEVDSSIVAQLNRVTGLADWRRTLGDSTVLVSIVQRHTALSNAQKEKLSALSERAVRLFKQVVDVEWVVTQEKQEVTVALRLRSRAGAYRASAKAATFSVAAHDVVEKLTTQGRRTKRDRIDRRDDHSPRGPGGRRGKNTGV